MKNVISVGTIAPSIQAVDLWGKEIHVPADGKWIYLSFHRFATCPFCNLRTNELIRNYRRFTEKNVEVISIWPSSKSSLLKYAESEASPFPMLSNKSKSLYQAYGVTESSISGGLRLMLHPGLIVRALRNSRMKMEIDGDPKLMPASFLVDPDGVVQMAYYGKHFGDHPSIESILECVKK